MSSPYEQSIGRALQSAAAGIQAPPESRWVPDRNARWGANAAITTIVAAILILLSGIAIVAIPRATPAAPAAPGDPFSVADDAAWARVRSMLPSALVLRPTWIPDEFKGTGPGDCPSPTASIQNADGTFKVTYLGTVVRMPPDPRAGNLQACTRVEVKTLKAGPEEFAQLVDVAPISARGTTVRVRVGPRVPDLNGQPHQLIYMNWREGGVSYELNTLDANLTDLTRMLHSLEPMT